MKANRSYDAWKYLLPKKSLKSLVFLASVLVCLILNSAQAQVTKSAKRANEPLNPKSELNKPNSVVDKQNSLPNGFPVLKDTGDPDADMATYNLEKTAWIAKNPELYKSMGISNMEDNQEKQSLPEPLPTMEDTGDFEADKADYRLAVEDWLKRNASLYSSEQLEFLKKPIVKPEERERTLKNL